MIVESPIDCFPKIPSTSQKRNGSDAGLSEALPPTLEASDMDTAHTADSDVPAGAKMIVLLGLSGEWGNEMMVNSYHRSFPHSLLSTSKLVQHKSDEAALLLHWDVKRSMNINVGRLITSASSNPGHLTCGSQFSEVWDIASKLNPFVVRYVWLYRTFLLLFFLIGGRVPSCN